MSSCAAAVSSPEIAWVSEALTARRVSAAAASAMSRETLELVIPCSRVKPLNRGQLNPKLTAVLRWS